MMLTYNGGHLTPEEIIAFDESMTFSDAPGYSRIDTDRIHRHLRSCDACSEINWKMMRAFHRLMNERDATGERPSMERTRQVMLQAATE